MTDLRATVEWLHIYPQSHWHDDASIVGTRKGLKSLRDALNMALADADGVASAQGFVNDGEGYLVGVYVVPFAEMERMQLPYTDRDLFNPNGQQGRMWPHDLPRKPKTVRLVAAGVGE